MICLSEQIEKDLFMNNNGHWSSHQPIDIDNTFGIVYRIASKQSDAVYYIGAKQLKMKVGKKYKESNWKEYTSSSKKLNELIEQRGHDNFSYTILDTAKNRSELKYKELCYQIRYNCMYDPKSLNCMIQVRINKNSLNKRT